jgi:hypothetical protein
VVDTRCTKALHHHSPYQHAPCVRPNQMRKLRSPSECGRGAVLQLSSESTTDSSSSCAFLRARRSSSPSDLCLRVPSSAFSAYTYSFCHQSLEIPRAYRASMDAVETYLVLFTRSEEMPGRKYTIYQPSSITKSKRNSRGKAQVQAHKMKSGR